MPAMNDYTRQLASTLMGQLFTDIRFRSEFSDEKVLLTGQELLDILSGKPEPKGQQTGLAKQALQLAKPTLVINSAMFGKKVWAPYGEADAKAPAMWRGKMKFWAFLGVAGLMGIGFGLGRLSVRSKTALKGLVRRKRR